jgi:carbonic anhydrase/acetyltransferase-like protein (isoleucine patch superfamily)
MIYALDGIAPDIDPSAWVAAEAVLIGKVVIEAGANIWFGAMIRGDNEEIRVGAGSNVQENSIGANCTIGHKAMLHGCTIGDGTLIGMGATILNGARIGKGCLIGACALVTEGKEIPDGSLVMGAPGKVIRILDAAARDRLLRSAAGYRANARRFAAGLRPA